MRRVLAILLLWTTQSLAQPPVLRFSIAESWSMPLMRTEDQQPVEGILFELMQAIAREADARPQYHVMARLRLEEAMQAGEIDVRCYVSAQWLSDRPGDYLWSIPIIEQRDLLIGRPG
ncbi:amino acid ABC transporter substrate-binding protein, partial [Pseudomonas mosselii]